MMPSEYSNPLSAPEFGLKIHFHISAVTTPDIAHGSKMSMRRSGRCGICSFATRAMTSASTSTPNVDQKVKNNVTLSDGRNCSLVNTSIVLQADEGVRVGAPQVVAVQAE